LQLGTTTNPEKLSHQKVKISEYLAQKIVTTSKYLKISLPSQQWNCDKLSFTTFITTYHNSNVF